MTQVVITECDIPMYSTNPRTYLFCPSSLYLKYLSEWAQYQPSHCVYCHPLVSSILIHLNIFMVLYYSSLLYSALIIITNSYRLHVPTLTAAAIQRGPPGSDRTPRESESTVLLL